MLSDETECNPSVSDTRILNNDVKDTSPQKNDSNGNLECHNSLPGSSKDNISEQYFNENIKGSPSENSELREFATIPSNIIESLLMPYISGDIDKEILQIITYHCCHKLSEVMKAATHYMKQCGRLNFTIEDFNKGLLCCGENPIINNNLPIQKKKRPKPKNSRKFENRCEKVPCVYIKETWFNICPFSESINNLPDELQSYFNATTEVLFSNDVEGIRIILNDIQTNENILQLVPHLLNFFSDAMSKFKYNFSKISILLDFLNVLLRNRSLYFGRTSYLNSLSFTLLKFLAEDLPHYDHGQDCWSLKDIAADILALILKRNKNQPFFFEVIYFLQSVLSFENSLNSHYGALVALNSIGVLAIFLLLPSYSHRFQEHKERTLLFSNKEKIDIHMVQGQIIHSYYLLVNYYYKNEFEKPKFGSTCNFNSKDFLFDCLYQIKVFPVLNQSSFSDSFGEALLPAFPLLNFVSHSNLKNRKRTNNASLNAHLKFIGANIGFDV